MAKKKHKRLPDYFSTAEAIERIGCSANTLAAWRRQGLLRGVQGGPGKNSGYFYSSSEVAKAVEWFAARREWKASQ